MPLNAPKNTVDPIRSNRDGAKNSYVDYDDWKERLFKEFDQPTMAQKNRAGKVVYNNDGSVLSKSMTPSEMQDEQIRILTESEKLVIENRPELLRHCFDHQWSAWMTSRFLIKMICFSYRLADECRDYWGNHFDKKMDQEHDEDEWDDRIVQMFLKERGIVNKSAARSLLPHVQEIAETFDFPDPTTDENSGDSSRYLKQDAHGDTPEDDEIFVDEKEGKTSFDTLKELIEGIGKAHDEDELKANASQAKAQLGHMMKKKMMNLPQFNQTMERIVEVTKEEIGKLRNRLDKEGTEHTVDKQMEAAQEMLDACFE